MITALTSVTPSVGPIALRWAIGSVPGREHQRLLAPNQDAVLVRAGDPLSIAVVADGCGSVATSGVAAQLLTTLFANAVARHTAEWLHDPALATALTEATLLAELRGMLTTLSPGEPVPAVRQWALATLLGAVITPDHVVIVRAGDGITVLNGEIRDPQPEQNAPAYLGYRLLDPVAPGLALERVVERRHFRGAVLATDGARPLLQRSGVAEWDALGAWVNDDACYQHAAMLGRRLRQLAGDRRTIDWAAQRTAITSGPLQDDTTVVLIAPDRADPTSTA
jgi:hypothetical protein